MTDQCFAEMHQLPCNGTWPGTARRAHLQQHELEARRQASSGDGNLWYRWLGPLRNGGHRSGRLYRVLILASGCKQRRALHGSCCRLIFDPRHQSSEASLPSHTCLAFSAACHMSVIHRCMRPFRQRPVLHVWVIQGEYVGELLSQEECERRGQVYDIINSSYLFQLNTEWAIDARKAGSKLRCEVLQYCQVGSCQPRCSVRRPLGQHVDLQVVSGCTAARASCLQSGPTLHSYLRSCGPHQYAMVCRFANHQVDTNTYARVMMVSGEHHVGMYAKTDMKAGEELKYDYGYHTGEGYCPRWGDIACPPGKDRSDNGAHHREDSQ